jgi:glutathione S-transferase
VTTLPILYSFRRCPYAMRARLALYTARVSHEHREIDLKNKPREMLEISPKGTVPVLQLEDGTVLNESLDIMQWAFKVTDLPPDWAVLIMENDTTFKEALDRYKYPGRYEEEEGSNYRDQCAVFLKKLEAPASPFLSGEELSLLDMGVLPFVRQFEKVNPAWFAEQPYPRLKSGLERLTSSALFEGVMERHPLWSNGTQPLLVVF